MGGDSAPLPLRERIKEMAYSDYGAFVYENGVRRRDKEDVGVYDTDEASLPSGMRIYANILKNMDAGTTDDWWRHSHHGVMGDGKVRVACYKQGFPRFYFWRDGDKEPTEIGFESIVYANGWEDEKFVTRYDEDGKLYRDYDYGYELNDFKVPDLEGYTFSALSNPEGDEAPRQIAWMTEPDGTVWCCEYDVEYGAGFEEYED